MSQQIFQASAASYCLLDNVSIFLDRRNDKYHYLDRQKTEMLGLLRNGLSLEGDTSSEGAPVDASVVKELTEKHLLTLQAEDGKALQPLAYQTPHASVYDEYWKMRFYPTTVVYLAFQHVSLLRRMKNETLYELTQKAEQLKAGIARRTRDVSAADVGAQARKIIDSRYYVYTYRDKCLFDSHLFFRHFVSKRIPVNWVFGVNLYPFAAHCWIEYKGLVLNDPLERVAAFTPIYII